MKLRQIRSESELKVGMYVRVVDSMCFERSGQTFDAILLRITRDSRCIYCRGRRGWENTGTRQPQCMRHAIRERRLYEILSDSDADEITATNRVPKKAHA